MQTEFFDSMDRLLANVCAPAVIRKIESGSADLSSIWRPLNDSGFLDLMVSENQGGAGLGWLDAWSVLFAVGRHGVALPVGQTMWGRSLVLHLNATVFTNSTLTFSGFGSVDSTGYITAASVPSARLSDVVLVQVDDVVYGAPLTQCAIEPVGGSGCFDANLSFKAQTPLGHLPTGTLAQALAVILAAQLAGAADRALEMTLNYANARQQFGKPIGRFQALQQQVSEMAEHVYAMRMASQLSVQTESWQPSAIQAALAKSQVSESAAFVARIAHAVHGAIGVTQEFDLQIVTRKLYEWARLGGGDQYWAAQLGRAALDQSVEPLDFVRQAVFGTSSFDLRVV